MSFCGFLFTPVLVWIFTLIIPIHVLLRKLRACDKCNKCLSESKPMVEIVFLSCATTPETKPPQERSPLWLEMASSFSGTWRPSSWRGSRFREARFLARLQISLSIPCLSSWFWSSFLHCFLLSSDLKRAFNVSTSIMWYLPDNLPLSCWWNENFTRIKSDETKKSAETSAFGPAILSSTFGS